MSTDLDTAVTTLSECVRVALAATDAGEPGRVCDVPGVLAWDDCDCGVLAVAVGRVFQSRSFPQEATVADLVSACTVPYLAATLTVTVLRCAPGPDSGGNGPSCAQLDTAALGWFADVTAVRDAVACCLMDLNGAGTVEEYVVGDTVPLGPEGGCVGSETRLTIGLLNCLCPAGA